MTLPDESPEAMQVHEELTAYLDGELEGPARQKVENRLAADASYRRELERLERAWGLLDKLGRSSVDDAFTRSTLEMVVVEAARDAEAGRRRAPAARLRFWLAASAVVLAACVLGLFVGRLIWPDPNRQLLQDLPVIENLDLYRQVEDIEFLRALEHQHVFAEEAEHAG